MMKSEIIMMMMMIITIIIILIIEEKQMGKSEDKIRQDKHTQTDT